MVTGIVHAVISLTIYRHGLHKGWYKCNSCLTSSLICCHLPLKFGAQRPVQEFILVLFHLFTTLGESLFT